MFLLKIDSCIFRQRTISSKTFFFQSYSFSLREGHNTHDAAVVCTQDHENPEKLLQQNFDHFKRIAVFECVLQRLLYQPFSSFYHYLVKDTIIIMCYAIVMVMPFHFSNNNRNLKCIKQYMIWSFSFLTSIETTAFIPLIFIITIIRVFSFFCSSPNYRFVDVDKLEYDGDGSRSVIRRLRKFTKYEIVIQAVNTFGEGPLSIPSIGQTKEDGKTLVKSSRFVWRPFRLTWFLLQLPTAPLKKSIAWP